MGMIVDLIVIVFIVVSFITMMKKGFIKGLASITSNILTIVLISALLTPVTEALSKTALGDIVRENVETALLQQNEDDYEDSENKGITSEIMKNIEQQAEKNMIPVVTDTVMRIIALIILVIVIKIVLWILFMILETIFKLPILSSLNKLAGGAAGIINSLLVIYLFCAILTLNFDWTNELRGIVDQTVVLKYFYINNILVNIFVH